MATATCFTKLQDVVWPETTTLNRQSVPCSDPSKGAAACCAVNDICLPGGLCLAHINIMESQSGWYVGGCTDQHWNSSACPQYCNSAYLPDVVYRGDNRSTTAATWACCGMHDGHNCDIPTNTTFQELPPSKLQSAGVKAPTTWATANLGTAQMYGNTSTSTDGTQTSALAGNTTAPSATRDGLSTPAIIGIAVGVGLFLFLVLSLLSGFFLWRWRRRAREELQSEARSYKLDSDYTPATSSFACSRPGCTDCSLREMALNSTPYAEVSSHPAFAHGWYGSPGRPPNNSARRSGHELDVTLNRNLRRDYSVNSHPSMMTRTFSDHSHMQHGHPASPPSTYLHSSTPF